MGMYLNPGNLIFSRISSQKIYVDKTGMLGVLNEIIKSENNYVCVSRPRRFGKTIAGNMICAYYSKGCDSRSLFAPFKISSDPSFEEGLNKYNVLSIDIGYEYNKSRDKKDMLFKLENAIRSEFTKQFADIVFEKDDSLADCIQKAYESTGEQFVILLDEYDTLVREKVNEGLFAEYLSFLNSLFKSNTLRPAMALAYLTGILPIIKDRVQSKLNNFKQYTILNPGSLAPYTGFTTEEVKSLCELYRMDYEECKAWYDGYRLSWNEAFDERTVDVYNPESVVQSMIERRFGNYWSGTSNYDVIASRLERNFDSVKDAVERMILGGRTAVNTWKYLNTLTDFRSRDDVFTYLIHLGYLAYDNRREECWVPNSEVLLEWQSAISILPEYKETDRIIEGSRELVSATIRGNEDAVAEALDRAHALVSSYRNYNNEGALQSAIYLAYMWALNRYACFKELPAGRGIADIVYSPLASVDKSEFPALIVELKYNKTPSIVMEQIKEKRYFDALSRYTGEVLLVGINYDPETKTHECKIERYEKDA